MHCLRAAIPNLQENNKNTGNKSEYGPQAKEVPEAVQHPINTHNPSPPYLHARLQRVLEQLVADFLKVERAHDGEVDRPSDRDRVVSRHVNRLRGDGGSREKGESVDESQSGKRRIR